MTGPITFSHETARNRLLVAGSVVTFRPAERTTGETWARWRRLGPARADVVVEHVGAVDPHETSDLEPHVEASGFESAIHWQVAIRTLHGGSVPESGNLYRVRLVGLRTAEVEA